MAQQPIILVTGATGAQGGSVARMLLGQKKFSVRILTRTPKSSKAIALQELGAEVVQGDLENIETLKTAMEGCYGVFGVTNFWEHFENEYQHGKNLIDAVAASRISHFVFSSLPDYFKLSHGTLRVPHCDLKASLEEYARALHLPVTFVHIAFYYENFLTHFMLQRADDGCFYFGFPQGDTPLAMASVEDMGGVVAAIFDHPNQYIGRTVGVVGEDKSCHEYAAIMSDVLKRDVRYRHIPHAEFASYGFAGAEELANMFEVQRLYIPSRQLHLIESYGLHPQMQPFRQWLSAHAHLFQLPETQQQISSAMTY